MQQTTVQLPRLLGSELQGLGDDDWRGTFGFDSGMQQVLLSDPFEAKNPSFPSGRNFNHPKLQKA